MKTGMSISISKPDFDDLRRALFSEDGLENAAFAICGFYWNEGNCRLLVRKVTKVPLEAYKVRTAYHLEISPSFINHVIDLAQSKFAILIIHSHRGMASLGYSPSDDFGEDRMLTVFGELIPNAPHASLLFGERAVIGRFKDRGRFSEVGSIFIQGRSLDSFGAVAQQEVEAADQAVYDRQILAFGKEFQAKLESLRIGIVGLGGTGSAVAEQLVRIGCRSLDLIDPDRYEPSNATRMYGSFISTRTKEYKIAIIRRHLKRINPALDIKESRGSVVSERVLESLRGCDVIFGCTDNDWSRSILNRFAYQYLTPVIDMGMRIEVQDKTVVGAAGRVSMVGPGMSCLWCKHHLDSERIRSESMNEKERNRLAKEGYVRGLDERAPAVISLNSTLAGMAVTMMLSSISGFSVVPRDASEQVYDMIEGIVFRSEVLPDEGCLICGDNGLKGLGILQQVSGYD
jgi:hypothetical protein